MIQQKLMSYFDSLSASTTATINAMAIIFQLVSTLKKMALILSASQSFAPTPKTMLGCSLFQSILKGK
jgi:hypothetical protein